MMSGDDDLKKNVDITAMNAEDAVKKTDMVIGVVVIAIVATSVGVID